MRVSSLFFMGILLVTDLLIASPGRGQNNSKKMTMRFKNASLSDVIKAIEAKGDVVIMYENTLRIESLRIDLVVKEMTTPEVLDKLVTGRNLKWTYKDDVIRLEDNNASETTATPAGHLKYPALDPPPPITVRGRIVNENGEPVIASVIIKGTKRGTTSDGEGKYQLDNVEPNAILVITATNIELKTISVNGQHEINIIASRKNNPLDEIVFKGYYSESKRLNTGNVAKVKSEDIQKQPILNPLQALSGRMAGVFIQETSGVPGSNINIRIRGQNSLRNDIDNNGNLPLYVIDGIPYPAVSPTSKDYGSVTGFGNPLNMVNPSSIESIEILKDADATAIYGSRGANGVILITTKKGKAGQTAFDVSISRGQGKVASKLEVLNARQYLEMRNEALANDGAAPGSMNSDYDLLSWDTTRSTDWQKQLIGGSAEFTNAQISISGGNEKTQFLLNTGLMLQGTVFPGNFQYKRGSALLNIAHQSANNRFRLNFSTGYSIDANTLPQADITGVAVSLAPVAPKLYTANGEINWSNSTWPDRNPAAKLLEKYKNDNYALNSSLQLSYEVLTGLEVKANLGYSDLRANEIRTNPVKAKDPASGETTGSAIFSNGKTSTWIIEPQLQYLRRVGDGKLILQVIATFQETSNIGTTILATGIQDDAQIENIRAASNLVAAGNPFSKYHFNSTLGRVNYNWKDKYVLNFTGRRDGSTRFGPGNRFGSFGSAAASWIFSNEEFINQNGFLSFGKIRASYGSTGNDAIGDFGYLNSFGYALYGYLGVQGLNPTRLANRDYSWESTRRLDIAIELGFVQNRILFNANWYRNRSSNQLIGLSIPATTGFTTIQYNFPATVQNTGWEFELNTINIERKDFSWKSSLNLTIPSNKLVDYPGINTSAYASTYEVGKSLLIQNKYHFTGVDPSTGAWLYEDVNNDGFISPDDDRQFIKQRYQTLFGGFQNTIDLYGVQLNFLFAFVKQTSSNYVSEFGMPGTSGNQPVEVMKRWRKAGDITDISAFTQDYGSASAAGFFTGSYDGDNNIGDASYIRLKNISLSYNFFKKNTSKIFKELRLYLQGQNLLTFTNYKGLDPETATVFMLPPLKMINVGIQAKL